MAVVRDDDVECEKLIFAKTLIDGSRLAGVYSLSST